MFYIPKILIVDDRPENLFVIEQTIKDMKVDIVKAENGNEALKATLNHDFALAILDVQMPNMDGYELAEFLRSEEKTKLMPIIFLSAVYSDDLHVFKGYQSGAVDFITKPFDPNVLISKINVFIELDRQRRVLEDVNEQLVIEVIERKKTEEKLREQQGMLSELNATKDKFFSILARDLRNPFNNIFGFAKLIADNLETLEPEKIKYHLDYIISTSKQMNSLMENLLVWSKTQIGKMSYNPQKILLKPTLMEQITIYNSSIKQKNISVDIQIPDELNLTMDLNMLMIILRNLLSNAVKFNREGGFIKITCNIIENEQIGNKMVEVCFEDGGIGIEAKLLPEIFKIESHSSHIGSSGQSGSGLGLIICKELVGLNHGKISVESEIGIGSKFCFCIPV